MAVLHDATSESHTGTAGSTSQASFSWTHTPVGTPRGVIVFVVNASNVNSNSVTGVTYGGVAMTRVPLGFASDSAGELGRVDTFFLGSGIPTGAQSIVVSRVNDATILYAVAATVTAAANTELLSTMGYLEGDGTVAQVNVDSGTRAALRYAAGFTGLAAPPAVGANTTLLHSIDFGNFGAVAGRETTGGSGSRPVGFSSGTSDDRAYIHVAIAEVTGPTVHDLAGTAAGVATASGALSSYIGFAGSAAGVGSVTAALRYVQSLAGSASGVATASGDLAVIRPVDLASNAGGASSASGALSIVNRLAGSAAGSATASGALSILQRLAGTGAGSASASGALGISQVLAGSAAGVASASGGLGIAHALAGNAAGTSGASGGLTMLLRLAGTAAGVGTATEIVGPVTHDLAGTAQGVATASGGLGVARALAGTATGVSGASGAISAIQALAGSASGSSTGSGALGMRVGFAGSASGEAAAAGGLRLALALAGVATGGSEGSGSLTSAPPGVRLPGNVTGDVSVGASGMLYATVRTRRSIVRRRGQYTETRVR